VLRQAIYPIHWIPGVLTPGGKAAEAGSCTLIPFSTEVENEWSHTYLLLYVFMACVENVLPVYSYPGLEEICLPARQCARILLDVIQFPRPDLVWSNYGSLPHFTNARYCERRNSN
jgi:hypothetical protein